MIKKFEIDIEKLGSEQISVLKAIHSAGEKHLQYYYSTMSVFKNPANRVKTHDTEYYEQVMPIVTNILRDYEHSQKTGDLKPGN